MLLPGNVPSISVFTNDSEVVGGHSNGHLVPTFTNYSFTGQAVVLGNILTCLGNLLVVSLSHLFGKSALLWNGTQFLDKKLEFFYFNAIEPYNATHWPHIPHCLDKHSPWYPHKVALWEQSMFASLKAIYVTGYKLVLVL
jgi:hypothetical protein